MVRVWIRVRPRRRIGRLMNRQPQVTEQTRAHLMQAFWELYLEKPIDKITIREIADRAGYNRATFYLHYRDVYDLFEQFEEGILGQIRQLVNDRLLSQETLDFSNHMGFIVQLAERFNDFMPRLLNNDPSFATRLKSIITPLLDRFIITDDALSADEQDILREFYATGLLSAISAWMSMRDRMPIDQFVELIVRTLAPQVGDSGERVE